MRLIGGNISDTPVKEIGDGSAFSVGGGAGDPDTLTIGTPTSAAVISGTRWGGCALTANLTPAGYWRAAQSIQVDTRTIVRLWREVSSNDVHLGVIQLDSDGSFSAVVAANDLSSDLGSVAAPMLLRLISTSGSNDGVCRVLICAPTIASARQHRFAVYDIDASGATTIHGAVQSKATTNDSSHNAVQGLDFVVCDEDYGIYFALDSNSTPQAACGVKMTTANQGFGSFVNGANGSQGSNYNPDAGYLSRTTDNHVWSGGSTIREYWTLTEDNPPTVARTNVGTVSSNDSNASSWATQVGQVRMPGSTVALQTTGALVPVVDTDDGAVGYWRFQNFQAHSPVSNIKFYNITPEDWRSSRVFSSAAYPLGSGHSYDNLFAPVDYVGEWIRGVGVVQNGTTGLHLIPINVNAKTYAINYGVLVATTVITPHAANTGCHLEAFYSTLGGHLNIFCDDTSGAAPSYFEVPIS